MRVIKSFFSFIVINLIATASLFAFEINYTTFEQRIDTGGYRELVLKNSQSKTIRYKIEIKETMRGADMSKWISIYPKVMTIPPFQSRVLKMYAQSPINTPKGEYGFKLIVTPLSVPVLSDSKDKVQVNASVDFVPVIQMYGYVGDPKFAENIILKDNKFTKDKKTERIKYSALVDNKSFAGLNLGIKFVTSNNAVIDGKYFGRIKAKTSSTKIEYELSKNVKRVSEIKKLIIYDATNLIDIKAVDLRK